MSGISSKTKVASLFSLVALLGATGALSGSLYLIDRAETKLEETIVTQKRMDDEALQFSALEKLANETADDRRELEEYILTEPEVIDFLSLIERVGINTGVAVVTKAIAVTPVADAPRYEIVSIDLELEGSSEGIREVIDLYEHLPYQSKIEKVSLDRSGTGEGYDLWRSAVQLSVTKVKQ